VAHWLANCHMGVVCSETGEQAREGCGGGEMCGSLKTNPKGRLGGKKTTGGWVGGGGGGGGVTTKPHEDTRRMHILTDEAERLDKGKKGRGGIMRKGLRRRSKGKHNEVTCGGMGRA